MFEWLYNVYNAEDKDYAIKIKIFLIEKKCYIINSDISDDLKKDKCDRINFLIDCIDYKYVI